MARQRTQTAAHISRLGGVIAGEHADTDRTAWQRTGGEPPARPGFEALLAALAASPGCGVAAWHADRIVRSGGDTERLITLCAAGGHLVETRAGGSYDLSTATGRKRMRHDASDAAFEVDHMQERIAAQKADDAAAGKPPGGCRSFGYSADGRALCRGSVIMSAAEASARSLEPVREVTTRGGARVEVVLPYDEAAELAEAITRIASASTGYSVARDWNSRGVRTSTGHSWTSREVRRVIAKPRNAGLVQHNGKILGPAVWPAVIGEATWRRAVAVLESPGRLSGPGPERRWLGSGIYICGVCGETMMAGATGRTGTGWPGYRCSSVRRAPGCRDDRKHPARDARALDAWVEAHMQAWLAVPGNTGRLGKAGPDLAAIEADLDRVNGRLDELAAEAGAEALTPRQLAIASKPLIGRRKALEERRDAGSRPDITGGRKMTGEELWADMAGDLGRRRALLAMILDVTVLPQPNGRPSGWRPGEPYFHRDCVVITPREL